MIPVESKNNLHQIQQGKHLYCLIGNGLLSDPHSKKIGPARIILEKRKIAYNGTLIKEMPTKQNVPGTKISVIFFE